MTLSTQTHTLGNTLSIDIVQMPVFPGKIEQNARFILDAIEKAQNSQKDWIVFPELCLSGYLLGDMWERPSFLRECENWQKRIVDATENITLFMGNIQIDWENLGEDGRPLKYNGALVAQNKQVLSHPKTGHPFVSKTLLPNYREFDDSRHFYDLRKWALENKKNLEDILYPLSIPLPSQKNFLKESLAVGVTLCEDGWSSNYAHSPFQILTDNGAELLLNLSCSPFTLGKQSARHRTFQKHAADFKTPILYVNSVGLQNNGKNLYTFDGSSTAYNPGGTIAWQGPAWKESIQPITCDLSVSKHLQWNSTVQKQSKPIEKQDFPKEIVDIYNALKYGTQSFMKQHNIQNVVIGVSGGIDSAVAAAMYRSFLPEDQILLVSMPGPYTSSTTRSLATQLGENTGCYFIEIPIAESVEWSRQQLETLSLISLDQKHQRTIQLTDFHLENVQARDRSSRILSALSSSFGGVFTCNANKTEMTIGYSTLYGDLGGYMALLGDLWKDQVYQLAQYLNQVIYQREVVPQGTIDIVPSAELSQHQDVTKGQGDPLHYPYHDKLFRSWIQRWNRATPEDNLRWYLEGSLTEELQCTEVSLSALFPTTKDFIDDLERWWNLYQGMATAKRVQAPPILSLSSRAFGQDHREYLGAPYYSDSYHKLKEDCLAL